MYHKKQLVDKLEFIENNFDFNDMLQKLEQRGILTEDKIKKLDNISFKDNKFIIKKKLLFNLVSNCFNIKKTETESKFKLNNININNSLPSYQFLRAVHSFLNDDYTKSSTANAAKTSSGGANATNVTTDEMETEAEQFFIGSHWLGALFFNKKEKIPKHTLPGYFQELNNEDLPDDSDSDDDSVTWEELYYGVTADDGENEEDEDENGGEDDGEDDGEEPIDDEVQNFMRTYGFRPSEMTGKEQGVEDIELDSNFNKLTYPEHKIKDMTNSGIIIRISLLIFAIVFIFSSISNYFSSIGTVNIPELQSDSGSNPLDFCV